MIAPGSGKSGSRGSTFLQSDPLHYLSRGREPKKRELFFFFKLPSIKTIKEVQLIKLDGHTAHFQLAREGRKERGSPPPDILPHPLLSSRGLTTAPSLPPHHPPVTQTHTHMVASQSQIRSNMYVVQEGGEEQGKGVGGGRETDRDEVFVEGQRHFSEHDAKKEEK